MCFLLCFCVKEKRAYCEEIIRFPFEGKTFLRTTECEQIYSQRLFAGNCDNREGLSRGFY